MSLSLQVAQKDVVVNLEMTPELFQSLANKYCYNNKGEIHKLIASLYRQAQQNFELFIKNMNVFKRYNLPSEKIFASEVISYLVPKLLSLSEKEPEKYNACIKDIILSCPPMSEVIHGWVKERWLSQIIGNSELSAWLNTWSFDEITGKGFIRCLDKASSTELKLS